MPWRCFIHTELHPKPAAAPGPLLPSTPYRSLLRDTSVLCSVNRNVPIVFYSLSVTRQFYYRSLNYPTRSTICLFLPVILAFDPHLTFQPCQCFKSSRYLKCRDNSDSLGEIQQNFTEASLLVSLSFLNADGWKSETSTGLCSHI